MHMNFDECLRISLYPEVGTIQDRDFHTNLVIFILSNYFERLLGLGSNRPVIGSLAAPKPDAGLACSLRQGAEPEEENICWEYR